MLTALSYTSTLPILCLAAQYSHRVYHAPKGKERHEHIPANDRLGTKAMTIKSMPVDAQDVIVFAIRGSARFMDWAVNMNITPVSPDGFLVGLLRATLPKQLLTYPTG